MATYTDANGNVWTHTTSNITALTLGSGQTVITMPTDNGAGQNFYTFTTAVFRGKTAITSVTIPDCYTSIPAGTSTTGAFYGCTGLATLVIGNGVLTIGDYACYNCSITSLTIGTSVTTIAQYAFYGNDMTSLSIPSSVTTIGGYAFGICYNITSIAIPDTVTSIGGSAFYSCTGATSLSIGTGLTTLSNSVFGGMTSLTSVTIPSNITTIETYAFASCTGLTSLTIGSGVSSIDMTSGFCNSCYALTEIVVNASNTYYANNSSDGVLYNYDKTELLRYPPNKSGTSFTIPSSVTTLKYNSFQYTRNITSITIPGNVTTIEARAFYTNSTYRSITSITFNEGLETIGDYAFYYQNAVTSITNFLPTTVVSIGGGAFTNVNTYSGSVSISQNTTTINSEIFSMTGLTAINVHADNPNYANYNGDGILYDKNITTIYKCPQGKAAFIYEMPDTITEMNTAFIQSNIISISIGSGVTSIKLSNFANTTSMSKPLELPSTITSYTYQNAGTSYYYKLIIGTGITSIGKLWYSTNARAVVFLGNVTAFTDTLISSSASNLRSLEFHQLTAPTSVAAGWLTNAPTSIRGHARRDSDFPAPGSTWNGLVMGEYLDEPEHGATGNIMYSSTGLSV